MAQDQPMPILRHEETKHRTIRLDHRSHDALHLDRQMPWMSERRLDHHPGRQHQNRDPRMEPIRQRRMAQTLGGNKMRKTTRITLAITVICMALAGCGSSAKASTQAHAAKPIDSQCTDGGTAHGFYECAITLSDTRKVDCVVYAWEKQGGLSCDWDHVSGVDKEPAR
jgi:hypothetical protein